MKDIAFVHLSRSDRMASTANSNHGDNESLMGLTTPSSTQASSPSASPALSLTDDRKRNKSESEDNQSQRNRYKSQSSFDTTVFFVFRSNSGANNSSVTSPKNPFQSHQHQSPSVLSSAKSNHPSAPSSASTLSTSAPPHFTYPNNNSTTLPVLQYSAIVSQNTVPSTSTTTTSSNTTASKQQILSPQTKQPSRQLPNGTGTTMNINDGTSTSASTLPISSVTTTVTNSSNNSHPPSLLLANNDRTSKFNTNHFLIFFFAAGTLSQHLLNNISQASSQLPPYSNSGSNANIPLDSSSSTSLDSAIISQQSSLLPRTLSENDRSTIVSNGSSDGHTLNDNAFSNIPSTSSFLSNNSSTNLGDMPPTNGVNSVIGQLASGIPINPDHHSLRYMLSSNILQQSNIQTGRVPLTQAEMRMLNRLNSAYAKLPSLLESERQR